MWNSDTCSFECEPELCINTLLYWDFDECACLCIEQNCPVGSVWNSSSCSCDCALSQNDCDGSDVFDLQTCTCVPCSVVVPVGICDEGFFWNPNCCKCECNPQECADGQSWFSDCFCGCNNELRWSCAD